MRVFYDNNVSTFSDPWNESYHDDPLFLFHFWIIDMYIFHLAKGQENLNSRSKMVHLPLSTGRSRCNLRSTSIKKKKKKRKNGLTSH